eukprot:gnl/TRDRNA2_/TRDRNA2_176664_c1_seq2.p1 gnl/TRDRNA2_/TRDRNA2_176664_c1~~gnl/TRDRNA2_/TRDRNA2_176664_c1_seq2.p1  ORF type:complete len:436 (-),score=44.42 gnl/TRDRNA2_/TRDRNA2_176664_c1_seq2:129-1436(-)
MRLLQVAGLVALALHSVAGLRLDEPGKNATILVTGAAGFIGSHGAMRLLEEGYRVVGIDDYSRGFAENVQVLQDMGESRFTFAQIDIGNETALFDFVATHRPVAIMHFAGVAYASESTAEPIKYYQNNTDNTMKIVKAMKTHGIKYLIYSSSCSTYGAPRDMPVTEETPQSPVSPYGRSKLFAEEILRDWVESQGSRVKVAALRYFNVIGADPLGRLGERPPKNMELHSSNYRRSVRLLTALLDAAQKLVPSFYVSGNAYNTSDGTPLRDYTHVLDIVGAHLAVLKTMLRADDRLPSYRFYNVGGGKATSVLELIKKVHQITGTEFPFKIGTARAGDPPGLWADTKKIEKEASWSLKYPNIEDGIRHEWEFRKRLQLSKFKVSPSEAPSAGLYSWQLDAQGAELIDEFGPLGLHIHRLQSDKAGTNGSAAAGSMA